jgi:hypothetical protein
MIDAILKRLNLLHTHKHPKVLRDDYFSVLKVDELIKIISQLPDKTEVCLTEKDGDINCYLVEFEDNPPRVYLI